MGKHEEKREPERRYYSPIHLRPRQGQVFTEPSKTKQEFAREADINVLVGKYGLGNLAKHPDERFYFDASAVPDYQSALNKITAAGSSSRPCPRTSAGGSTTRRQA